MLKAAHRKLRAQEPLWNQALSMLSMLSMLSALSTRGRLTPAPALLGRAVVSAAGPAPACHHLLLLLLLRHHRVHACVAPLPLRVWAQVVITSKR